MGSTFLYAGIVVVMVFCLAITLLWRRQGPFRSRILDDIDSHTEFLDTLGQGRTGLWIALAAALGLFTELMIIRVHASYFQLFAYFKNISLLSCFLGLGVGYAKADRPVATPLVLPMLSAQVVLMYLLRYSFLSGILQNPVSEQVTLGLAQAHTLVTMILAYLFLSVVFLLNAVAFIPLGQLASRIMSLRPKLEAYGWNLVGSLAGIAAFSFLAYAWTGPIVWFAVTALATGVFLYGRPRTALLSAVATVVVLTVLSLPIRKDSIEVYSPYQVLTMTFNAGKPPTLRVCNVYFQRMLDMRKEARARDAKMERYHHHYSLPYELKKAPKDVLIVGSGTGNDVATAVRKGAGRIDAVEIDPAIIAFGRRLHPEAPYSSPRVTVHATDAREFIRSTKKRYDMIVYGVLDSHTLLSGRAGVRLDSYVYTVEAIREARAKLKAGGVICLSFCLLGEEMGRKIYLMMKEAFGGRAPEVFFTGYDSASYFFVIGNEPLPAGRTYPSFVRKTDRFANFKKHVDVSTDDWPFLYMHRRTYPLSYLLMLVVLLAVTFLFIRKRLPGIRQGFSWPCFFLGAGFMLIETKGITELALAYGSTWMVTSVVIAAVLTMAFLANAVVRSYGAPRPVITYGLLILSVVAGMAFTSSSLAKMTGLGFRLLMTSVLTLPLFFSGFAFSSELKGAPTVAVALSSNLLGSMLGGLVEYNSMYFGFRFLYYAAAAMYAAAFITSLLAKRSAVGTSEGD